MANGEKRRKESRKSHSEKRQTREREKYCKGEKEQKRSLREKTNNE